MNLLILGGTTEGAELAHALAGDRRWNATVSFAGRTLQPAPLPLPCRVGGFGGPAGLARYLTEHGIDLLIDATHPFAAQMTRNAAEAAGQTAIPLLRVSREPWRAETGDRWVEVADMREAAEALGPVRRRVLLTIGQKDLAPFAAAPWHDYLIRSVETPAHIPPGSRTLAARGPFEEANERALLERERIEILVTKNSGGNATRPKLLAARALGIAVIMVARPPTPPCLEQVATSAEALVWLERHAALRGE
jgi:precorrin-6A/cobalt-precorrin-6A reductase